LLPWLDDITILL